MLGVCRGDEKICQKWGTSGSDEKNAVPSKEIRTLTIETSVLPGWSEAKSRLFKEGKMLTF
jgi:hypothetical protein